MGFALAMKALSLLYLLSVFAAYVILGHYNQSDLIVLIFKNFAGAFFVFMY